MRNFAKFTIKHLCQNLFFSLKLNSKSAASLKTRPQRRCFLVNYCKFRKNTFFAEHHQTTASDYSNINSIVMKEELANKSVTKITKQKPCTNLSQKFNLLRTTLQVKEHVPEAVRSQTSVVVQNFVNSTGKHMRLSLLVCYSIEKKLQHKSFPVKFMKFLRIPFFTEQLRGCF